MQGHFKNGTMMTLDTAVWNLEALLTNFGGYPDSASDKFILMRSHFTLPINANGLVSMDDVQALYQQMVDSITVQLNSIAGTVKFLKFSDVRQDSVVGGTAYITSNNGYGQGFILGLYPPFTDDWIWGTLGEEYGTPPLGNCDGTDLTSDGSDEIQYRLTLFLHYYNYQKKHRGLGMDGKTPMQRLDELASVNLSLQCHNY